MLTIDYANRKHADVYGSDKTKSGKKVIVVVHGGGMLIGSRLMMKEICLLLSKELNAVCVAPSYRLSSVHPVYCQSVIVAEISVLVSLVFAKGVVISPKPFIVLFFLFFVLLIVCLIIFFYNDHSIKYPNHAMDIAECVRWVSDNIHHHGGSKQDINLLGHSAGGYLVSLIGLNPFYLKQFQMETSVIKGIVSLSGMYSWSRLTQMPFFGSLLLQSVFQCDTETDRNRAFPVTYLTSVKHDDEQHYVSPPFLLISAEVDFSLHDHAFDFYHALRSAGTKVGFKLYPRTTHISIRCNWENENSQVFRDIVAFFRT
jgi:acetyl esterase/lipase